MARRQGRAARLQDRVAASQRRAVPRIGTQTPPPPGHVLIIACGALAREILDIKKTNSLDHIDLTCLPADLHLYPDRISQEVETAVTHHAQRYTQIYVAYADCGTGGLLAQKCAELGVEMIKGPHCYSFFEGNAQFVTRAQSGEHTAFYLTDFLVKQFDAFVWRPMGLDKHPELRDMIFGNYTTLIYQSQTRNPELLLKAQSCAQRMGLEFEYRYTGYGDLERSMVNWAAKTQPTP